MPSCSRRVGGRLQHTPSKVRRLLSHRLKVYAKVVEAMVLLNRSKLGYTRNEGDFNSFGVTDVDLGASHHHLTVSFLLIYNNRILLIRDTLLSISTIV